MHTVKQSEQSQKEVLRPLPNPRAGYKWYDVFLWFSIWSCGTAVVTIGPAVLGQNATWVCLPLFIAFISLGGRNLFRLIRHHNQRFVYRSNTGIYERQLPTPCSSTISSAPITSIGFYQRGWLIYRRCKWQVTSSNLEFHVFVLGDISIRLSNICKVTQLNASRFRLDHTSEEVQSPFVVTRIVAMKVLATREDLAG